MEVLLRQRHTERCTMTLLMRTSIYNPKTTCELPQVSAQSGPNIFSAPRGRKSGQIFSALRGRKSDPNTFSAPRGRKSVSDLSTGS